MKNLNDKLDDLLNLTTVQGEDIKLRVDAAYAVAGLKAKTKTQGRKKTVGKNKIEKKITINPGDWVSINRQYAVDHGQAHVDGNYKILSKTVKAKELFTDGNSIHEWGYDPR